MGLLLKNVCPLSFGLNCVKSKTAFGSSTLIGESYASLVSFFGGDP